MAEQLNKGLDNSEYRRYTSHMTEKQTIEQEEVEAGHYSILRITDQPETVMADTCGAGDIAYLQVRVISDRYGRVASIMLPDGQRVQQAYQHLWVEKV